MPRVSNVEHYARIAKDKAILRNIADQAAAITEEALAASDEPHLIAAKAQSVFNTLVAEANFSTEPSGYMNRFDSWEEFESCSPLNFSIGGFLQNAGATMIGGPSGQGKTLILCLIARALLKGKGAKLWDMFPVEENAVRVMYLIPECARAPFKHRLKLFGIYDHLAPDDGRLIVRTLSKGAAPDLSDPAIPFAAKGAHVILDTASRFGDGDENLANDNARGLANDIFALLASGARSVIAAHRSPKSFSKESVMALESVLRRSGDVGAMLTTAWGIKQIEPENNVIHIENIKPRDFQPCAPFEIIGRPYIDNEGDFRLHKAPGECGKLIDEQPEVRNAGGAPRQQREAKAANIALVRNWIKADPAIGNDSISNKFKELEIEVSEPTVRKYRMEVKKP